VLIAVCLANEANHQINTNTRTSRIKEVRVGFRRIAVFK